VTAYELYLLLHIGAALAWVGAGLATVMLGTRASLARDASRIVAFAHDSEWLGLRLFLPANLLAILSAVLLVTEGDWGWGHLWIQLGLAGYLVSFLTGLLFFGPGWGRVGKLADRLGADSPAVQSRVRGLLLGSRLDLGVLLGVVFVMVTKPTGDEVGALAITAAIPAAFAVLALGLYQAERRQAPTAHVLPEPR
jgi:uncharacterized membrane protein